MRLRRVELAKPTVPQTARILLVTRRDSSGLLNFATYSPQGNRANATESSVLRVSSAPDGRG
jgi:hypothetical protein